MLKIYLDTSVLSAYFDLRKPMRQLITQKWFQNDLKKYNSYISTLVLQEIGAHPDDQKKAELLSLVDQYSINVLELNDGIFDIAASYRKKVIPKEINDSLHLATAAFYKLDAIVSWNFKHIVNLKTIKMIHVINLTKEMSPIEIVSLENLGGDKYGSL